MSETSNFIDFCLEVTKQSLEENPNKNRELFELNQYVASLKTSTSGKIDSVGL